MPVEDFPGEILHRRFLPIILDIVSITEWLIGRAPREVGRVLCLILSWLINTGSHICFNIRIHVKFTGLGAKFMYRHRATGAPDAENCFDGSVICVAVVRE